METRRRRPLPDNPTRAASPRASGTIHAGLILNDRYEILKYLRGGSASEIYVARHITLQNYVAVKIMREPLVGRRDLLQRMILEAQALANLRDPNLVRTFDAGSVHGRFYIVMDLLEGLDLRDLLNQQGPQSLLRALYIIRDAASGLVAAHSMGAIHRDIKPENIILTNRDEVVVIDLGVMKIHSAIVGAMHRHITEDARIPGTIAYMCPQQLGSGVVDARTDTFALCIVFYELLTTCHPQWAVPNELPPEEDLRRLMLRWDPPRPVAELRPDLPAAVQPILDKGLAADPADRFQSMSELLDLFEEVYTLHQAALAREESCPAETASTLAETAPGIPARLRLANQAKPAPSEPVPSTETPTMPGIPSRLLLGASCPTPPVGTRIDLRKREGTHAPGKAATTPTPLPAKVTETASPKTPPPPSATTPARPASRLVAPPSRPMDRATASLERHAHRRDEYLASIPAHVPPDPVLLDPEVEKVQLSPSLFVPTATERQPEKAEPRAKRSAAVSDSITPAPSATSKPAPAPAGGPSRAVLAAMSAAIGIAIGAVTFGTALRPRSPRAVVVSSTVERSVEPPSRPATFVTVSASDDAPLAPFLWAEPAGLFPLLVPVASSSTNGNPDSPAGCRVGGGHRSARLGGSSPGELRRTPLWFRPDAL